MKRFTCDCCKGEFVSPYPDEAAREEERKRFGANDEGAAIVCDVCYRRLMAALTG